MEKINVAIVDDDRRCIDHLCGLLNQLHYVNIVGTMTGSDRLVELLQTKPIDLLFLDIMMNGEDGFSVAEYVKKHYPEKMIIFTTGFDDFALRGYDYNPLDFLIKPVSRIRLEKALSYAMGRKDQTNQEHHAKIGIQTSQGVTIIEVETILYVEKTGRKVEIVYAEEAQLRHLRIYSTLGELEKVFEAYHFIRIHQSFLVPIYRVSGILSTDIRNSYEVELKGTTKRLPLSRSKYNELKSILEINSVCFI